MKKEMLTVLFLSFAVAIAAFPAFADSVLYDNTTASSGTAGGLGLSPAASDSFILTSSATVTGATFNIWISTYPYTGIPASLTSIDWSIGTGPFDSSLGSASGVDPSSTTLTIGLHPAYDTAEESITIPDITLAAGTYWFTIGYPVASSSPVASNGSPVFWDYSFGPSGAYSTGSVAGSETFQILGDTGGAASVVPEPSGLLLLGTGLVGLTGVIRCKFGAKALRAMP